jgi:integrase
MLDNQAVATHLLTNPNTGKSWHSTDGFRKHWVKIFEELNIKYRNPYQMRHTFASMLVSKGENTYKVAKYLGHKDTEMVVKIYGKYLPEDESKENIFTSNYNDE